MHRSTAPALPRLRDCRYEAPIATEQLNAVWLLPEAATPSGCSG